jgi:hypothetical protein
VTTKRTTYWSSEEAALTCSSSHHQNRKRARHGVYFAHLMYNVYHTEKWNPVRELTGQMDALARICPWPCWQQLSTSGLTQDPFIPF